jgi:hypothetical protein
VNVISNRTGQNMVKAQVRLLAALVMGVIATATACSSDSTPADEATDSANPTDSASSLLVAPEDIVDPSAAAVAAYERYWRTVAEATTIPDPNYPELDEVAAGQALESARSLVQGGVDENRIGTGYPSHTAEVTEVYPTADPTELAIADCMDSTGWLVLDADSGEPIPDEEYGTSKVSALVERVDDRWLVTEVLKQRIGSCLGARSFAPSLSSV